MATKTPKTATKAAKNLKNTNADGTKKKQTAEAVVPTVQAAKPAAVQTAAPTPSAKPKAEAKAPPVRPVEPLKDMEQSMFCQTIQVETEVRFMTSGGDCRFWNPLASQVMENDAPNRWLRTTPGSRIHLVSWTETPDTATVLLEIPTADGTEFLGTVVRKASWGNIQKSGKPQEFPVAIQEPTMVAAELQVIQADSAESEVTAADATVNPEPTAVPEEIPAA